MSINITNLKLLLQIQMGTMRYRIAVLVWQVLVIVQVAIAMPPGHGNVITFETCRRNGYIDTMSHAQRKTVWKNTGTRVTVLLNCSLFQ